MDKINGKTVTSAMTQRDEEGSPIVAKLLPDVSRIRAGRVHELKRSSCSKFKMFGISSVQCSSLVTSVSGKFVQFGSGHEG